MFLSLLCVSYFDGSYCNYESINKISLGKFQIPIGTETQTNANGYHFSLRRKLIKIVNNYFFFFLPFSLSFDPFKVPTTHTFERHTHTHTQQHHKEYFIFNVIQFQFNTDHTHCICMNIACMWDFSLYGSQLDRTIWRQYCDIFEHMCVIPCFFFYLFTSFEYDRPQQQQQQNGAVVDVSFGRFSTRVFHSKLHKESHIVCDL